MSFAILGMGTAVPDGFMSQAEAGEIARSLCCRTPEQETWLPVLYSNTGIETRHTALDRLVVEDVLHGTDHTGSVFLPTGSSEDRGPTTAERLRHYAEHAGNLALRAARQALAQASLSPSDITHLVTVSCTGFRAPGVDIELIHGLELSPTTQRVNIGFMGCHGALNALRVAAAHTGADRAARVMVCATELCSLHYHYGWDPQKIIANAIFADGAGAIVGAAPSSGPNSSWRLAASGSCVFSGSLDAMTWTVGDHGFEMTLSKSVPALIAAHLRPWLESWLARQGIDLERVASWAIHPGGPRILDAVEDALDINKETTAVAREIFARFGNMSSPTMIFILDRLRQIRAPRPCVALGFGPGLTAEAALFQ